MSAKYFSALGLPVEYYLGTDGKRLGLRADGVTGKFLGTWLSHRSLWACMRLLPEDEFLVLEDDAKFCPDWQSRLTAAMECVPEDWDIINLGPCIKQVLAHVAGEVWTCEAWCLHACVIRKKALGAMIGAADEFGTKYTIDDGLLKFAYPRMHVYATLPSIVDQWAG